MTAPALPVRFPVSLPAASRERVLAAAAAMLAALILAALVRRLAGGGLPWPTDGSLWLALHLATVIPALPLGAMVLFGRKGTPAHRRLGRVWAMLMIVGALSSFGLTGLMGHLSPIHLLSVITLIGVPRGVALAIRGDLRRHRRTMLRVYTGLVVAGGFAFVPGRLLAVWLWG